ncbi:hypothetical protein J2S43_004703 [Catenuloplanes nepalensis]|uniref:Uncharacterized protein n=1 Tax=Catenuloplanes nepalensis TaxID=587533 RepID=A0ABT9MYS8_9ACTN|nr:hypothetical protein [Catenuloplanes nepalensis]MDP9796191.1 hypothetical protein [Catenuloplanes nepalensis]
MVGTPTAGPLSSLCPDGRLIVTGNGALFHPYPMDVPVDLLAVVRALQAPRENGPAFFLSHASLTDPAALGAVERVASDLLPGQHARIAAYPVAGTEQTAVRTWLTAADAVGVPISVPYESWIDLSPRVIRVDRDGRPAPTGEFVRVLPKGLTLMRAALGTAATLTLDPSRTPWQRLGELVASLAARREELRMPRSGALAGAKRWQAGLQLAAGVALGLPGTPDRDPLTADDLLRLWSDPPPAAGPETVIRQLLERPDQIALVRRGDTLLWLAAHDGALWWVDLASDGDPIRRFDPDHPLDRAALTATGTSVHLIDPATVPRPLPAGRPDTSGWQPVGDAAAVDTLRAQFPQLAGLNQDRVTAGLDWITNCVISSIAAVAQMLDPGKQFLSVPMELTNVDVLPFVVENGRMRDTDRMETIAAALPVPGATGFVIVGTEYGAASHAFVARRVRPVRAGTTDPFEGIAFYETQTHAQATAPVDPMRLRFVGVTGTGVDTRPIDAAPSRTPAAARQSGWAGGPEVADVAGAALDPPASVPAGVLPPARFAGLTAEANRLAASAAPAAVPPAAPAAPSLAGFIASYRVALNDMVTRRTAAENAAQALRDAWDTADGFERRYADGRQAIRDLERRIADAALAVSRAESEVTLAEVDTTPAAATRLAAAQSAVDRRAQERKDLVEARESALRAEETLMGGFQAAVRQIPPLEQAFQQTDQALTVARNQAEQLRILTDAAQSFPTAANGLTSAQASSLRREAQRLVDDMLTPQERAATTRVTRTAGQLNGLRAPASGDGTRPSIPDAERAAQLADRAAQDAQTRHQQRHDAARLLGDAIEALADARATAEQAAATATRLRREADAASTALTTADQQRTDLERELTDARQALATLRQAHRADPVGPEPDDPQIARIEARIEANRGARPGLEAKANSTDAKAAKAEREQRAADAALGRQQTAYDAADLAHTTAANAHTAAETALTNARTALRGHPTPGEMRQRLFLTGWDLQQARAEQRAAARQLGDARTRLGGLDTQVATQEDLTRFGDRDDPAGDSAHSYLSVGSELSMAEADAEAVRRMVHARIGPSVHHTQREQMSEEIDWLTTPLALTGDLPSATGKSGSIHVIGTGDHALRVTIRATLTRNEEPDVLPDYPTPMTNHGENRKYHASSNTTGQQTSTVGEYPVSVQPFIPISWGPFRIFNLAGTLRVTHNKYTRITNTDLGAGQGTVERLRGPGYAHSYTVAWTASAEPASKPLPDPTVPAPATPMTATPMTAVTPPVRTRLTVNFPEHMAMPQRPAITQPPAEAQLANELMSLDTFHDPAGIGRHILGVLPRLAGFTGANRATFRLSPESQREVLEFSGFGNTHSSLSRLRRDGLLSNTLRDVDGKEIGILRLRAVPAPAADNRIVTQTTNNTLEFYHQIRVQERGSARLRSGAEGSVNAGLTGIFAPIEKTTVAGTYGSMSASATGAAGHGVTVGTNTGTNSEMGRGLRSAKDATPGYPGGITRGMVADLDTRFTVELLVDGRTDAAPAQRETWTGRAADQEGMRARWVPYTLGNAGGMHMTHGMADGDAPGLVIYENLRIEGRDYTTPRPAGSPRPASVDDWVRSQLHNNDYLAAQGAGDARQALNHRRLLDVTSSFYREAMADDLRGDGIWVPFERATKAGLKRLWVRYFARPVAGTTPTHHGSTTEMRMNTSVDSFFRSERIRSHFTTKRWGVNVNGNIPLKKMPGVPDGTPPPEVPAIIEEKAAKHPWNTFTISGTPIGHSVENSVSSVSGQVTARSVILSSSAGQPVHKFTVDMQLDAEIYQEGALNPWKTYSTESGETQRATMDIWAPDMRVTATPQTRTALPARSRPVTAADEARLRHGPALPNLSGVTGVRGSAALNTAFRDDTRAMFGARRYASLVGHNPGSDATLTGQARRAFLTEARLIAAIDPIMRSSHSTEQAFEDGALSVPEGRYELQAYVRGVPGLIPARPGAQNSTYVEDGNQLFDSHELIRQGNTDRNHSAGPGVSFRYGNAGGQVRAGRGHRESGSATHTGIDYRINNYELPVHSVAIPVTYIGTSTFAARNPASSAKSAFGGGTADTRRFALDVSDAIESLVSVNDLATLWHSLETTWPHDATRPVDTGRTLPDGTRAGPEFVSGLDDALLGQVLDAKRILFRAPGTAPAAGEEVYYLPRRISGRQGLGDASVLDVQLEPAAPPPAPPAGTAPVAPPPPLLARALFDEAVSQVKAKLPGVLDPGSTTYKAGLYESIGVLTSSVGSRTGVRRFFSAGETNDPVRLGRVAQVTTVHATLGARVVEVEVLARPAARYSSTPPAGDPTELYGVPHRGADLEMHGMSGKHKQRSQNDSDYSWALRVAGTGHPLPSRQENVRLTGATGSGDAYRQHNKGNRHREQQVHRFITKSGGNLARASVPLELGVKVTVTPLKEWVLSSASARLGAAWDAHRPRLTWVRTSPGVNWHRANVSLEFMKEDGSTDRLTTAPPANQNRPATLFDPGPAGTVPHPVTVAGTQPMTGTAAQPHFTAAEVGTWAPFDGLNERFRISRFGAAHLMADAAARVLPTADPTEIQELLDNEVGGANTYALMSNGGVDLTVLNNVAGLAHELDLEIKPVKASAWRSPLDTYVDQHGNPQRFSPGELTPGVFEYFPIYATSTTTTASTAQVYGVSLSLIQSYNLGGTTAPGDEATARQGDGVERRQAVLPGGAPTAPGSTGGGGYYNIRPEYGAAPGNQTFMNVTYPGITIPGGKQNSSAATVSHVDRRGQRIVPHAAGGTDQTRVPYVLRERDVLFEVKGTTPRDFHELGEMIQMAGAKVGEMTSDGRITRAAVQVGLKQGFADAVGEKIHSMATTVRDSVDPEPVVSTVYVASTVQVRIPLAELQPSRPVSGARHLAGDRTDAGDTAAAAVTRPIAGWTALVGEATPMPTGHLVGGRTTAVITQELDAIRQDPAAGTAPTPANVVLIGGDHRRAGEALSAATHGWVLAQARNIDRHAGLTDPVANERHRYQRAMEEPTTWELFENGTSHGVVTGTNIADAIRRALTRVTAPGRAPTGGGDVAGLLPGGLAALGTAPPADLFGATDPFAATKPKPKADPFARPESDPFAAPRSPLDPFASRPAPSATPAARPVDPATLPGRDRSIRTLGDFSGPAAAKALKQITDGVRASAGGPVIAISLGGTPETAKEAVRRLDEMLRHDGWLGESPIVAATMGTNQVLDAFTAVRLGRGAVTVLQGMAGFEPVWQLFEPGAANPSRMDPAPDGKLFGYAAEVTPVATRTLARPLAEWLRITDWAGAEQYQRANDARLRTPEILGELRDVVAQHPGDLRLRAFLTALSAADRAGGLPAAEAPRLVPAATSFLDVEPPYDPAAGPMPATFVYDYLRSAGGTRRERYALDGLLFQLMVAGQLTRAETAALTRGTAAHRLDRANATVFDLVLDLREISGERLLNDPDAVLREFLERAGRLAGTLNGALPEDCLDPIDRTAWVARLDFLRDLWRESGDRIGSRRADILDAITYTLSNC